MSQPRRAFTSWNLWRSSRPRPRFPRGRLGCARFDAIVVVSHNLISLQFGHRNNFDHLATLPHSFVLLNQHISAGKCTVVEEIFFFVSQLLRALPFILFLVFVDPFHQCLNFVFVDPFHHCLANCMFFLIIWQLRFLFPVAG